MNLLKIASKIASWSPSYDPKGSGISEKDFNDMWNALKKFRSLTKGSDNWILHVVHAYQEKDKTELKKFDAQKYYGTIDEFCETLEEYAQKYDKDSDIHTGHDGSTCNRVLKDLFGTNGRYESIKLDENDENDENDEDS